MSHDQWFTPRKYVEMAETVLGGRIDLDPASCSLANQQVRARRILTKDDDMLTCDWPEAERVWCNCPYTREAGTAAPYLERLVEMYDAGTVGQAVVLTNASTSTNWWHTMAERFPFCLVDHRIAFIDGTGEKDGKQPRYANSFFFLPPNDSTLPTWERVFGDIGVLG